MNKRFIASCTLAAFASIAVPVAALPASGQASLTAKGGKVLAKQADGQWNDISESSLRAGDQVRTGTDGTAILRLNDSIVRLGPNSQVTLGAAETGVSVVLERGRLLGSTSSSLQVETAKTLTKANAGEFVVETTATGTGLNVLSGNARLLSKSSEPVTFGFEEAAAEIFATDNLSEEQFYGVLALSEDAATEPETPVLVAQDDGDDDEGGDDGGDGDDGEGGGGGNAALWTIVGAGGLAALLIALSEGDEENPSPSLP